MVLPLIRQPSSAYCYQKNNLKHWASKLLIYFTLAITLGTQAALLVKIKSSLQQSLENKHLTTLTEKKINAIILPNKTTTMTNSYKTIQSALNNQKVILQTLNKIMLAISNRARVINIRFDQHRCIIDAISNNLRKIYLINKKLRATLHEIEEPSHDIYQFKLQFKI